MGIQVSFPASVAKPVESRSSLFPCAATLVLRAQAVKTKWYRSLRAPTECAARQWPQSQIAPKPRQVDLAPVSRFVWRLRNPSFRSRRFPVCHLRRTCCVDVSCLWVLTRGIGNDLWPCGFRKRREDQKFLRRYRELRCRLRRQRLSATRDPRQRRTADNQLRPILDSFRGWRRVRENAGNPGQRRRREVARGAFHQSWFNQESTGELRR